jgi:hypothetical protein
MRSAAINDLRGAFLLGFYFTFDFLDRTKSREKNAVSINFSECQANLIN